MGFDTRKNKPYQDRYDKRTKFYVYEVKTPLEEDGFSIEENIDFIYDGSEYQTITIDTEGYVGALLSTGEGEDTLYENYSREIGDGIFYFKQQPTGDLLDWLEINEA